MGEDERSAGNFAGSAGTGGDVLGGAPALVEQGEPAFAKAAQGPLDGIAGAGVDIEFPAAGWLFDGNQDADACTLVAGSARVGSLAAAAW